MKDGKELLKVLKNDKEILYDAMDYILISIDNFKKDFPSDELDKCVLLFAGLAYFISRYSIHCFVKSLSQVNNESTAQDIRKLIMHACVEVCEYIKEACDGGCASVVDIN